MSTLQNHDSALQPMTPALRLEQFGEQLLSEAVPMSQNTRPGNIGFGWIYYGLVRNLDPDFVVAIGSCAGFAPFCAGAGETTGAIRPPLRRVWPPSG